MEKYSCKICNRGFKRNEHLIRHMNKKISCSHNIPNIPNIPEYSENQESDNLKSDNQHNCEKCLKCFSTKYNLNKHTKNNVCGLIGKNLNTNTDTEDNFQEETIELNNVVEQLKGKDSQIDMLIEQNCEMQKQNKQLQKLLIEESVEHKKQTAELHKMIFDLIKKETKKKLSSNKTDNRNSGTINNDNSTTDNSTTNNTNNNTNNTNTNNGTINNNITIQFGKEDLSQIDNKHFLNLIKSNSTGAKIITDIVKMIHFNEDCPQFQNICMSDLNRGRVIMYDGNKWNTVTNGDKIIPDLIEKAVSYSHSKDNQLREEYKKNPRVIGRMDVIKKHTNRCDVEHLEDLREEQFNEEADNKDKIADCEQFIILVSNRVKELIYNEKDKVIKRKESSK